LAKRAGHEGPARRALLAWPEARRDTAIWEALRLSPRRVLILDFDGTLSPFVDDPAEAGFYPGVRGILDDIMARPHCRVVFVTGRDAEDLAGRMALARAPEVWGSHGGQRLLPSGEKQAMDIAPELLKGLERAEAWAREHGLEQRLERKPGCLAFHLRGLPRDEARALRERVSAAWSGPADESGLAVLAFDGGLELRVPGFDKGRAVRHVLDEEGKHAAVFYLGDDLTDEDAFAALEGRGVGVLVRSEIRPTRARWRLAAPAELLEFLTAWRDAC